MGESELLPLQNVTYIFLIFQLEKHDSENLTITYIILKTSFVIESPNAVLYQHSLFRITKCCRSVVYSICF